MKSNSLSVLLLGAIYLAPGTNADTTNGWTVGQTVNTSSGPVNGHAASIFTDVSEYLGIPFAQPPVGKLRFQPPVKYAGEKPIDANKFGFSCVTAPSAGAGLPDADKIPKDAISSIAGDILMASTNTTKKSEDCLTLNIWTKPQAGESKKAVMVWIHGGSYTSGSSSVSLYDGQTFTEKEDVVLVSINYRLSIFGFPGNPVGRPNLGLLDQRLAIEWIRDNIASFGGDPSRITLFGESAGGGSADFYSYTWTKDPIVAGLILMSGSAFGTSQLPNDTANAFWFNATANAGCGGNSTDPEKVYECMMSKSAADIASILPKESSLSGKTPFNPVIDESLVFSDYKTRKPIKAPVLVGNTDYELGLGLLSAPEIPEKNISMFNSLAFVCPAAMRAASSVLHGNPTWRYRWFGEFPNTKLTLKPPSKAYHTSELSVLFNTTLSDLVPDTPEERAIGLYFRGIWAAFAKDPAKGLLTYESGLPMYSTNQSTLIRLAYDNKTGPNFGIGGQYDMHCIGTPTVMSPNGTSGASTTPNAPNPTNTVSSSTRFEPIAAAVFGIVIALGFAFV